MLGEIVWPLLCGIAIFLFGMKVMELALHQWAGGYLKAILERSTRTPWRGLLTGTGVTAALQSSTAVTVISIGMVNARLLTYPRTLGIILGTNIGTCLTTELIAFNIGHLAIPMLLSGFTVWMVSWLIPAGGVRRSPLWTKWIKGIRYAALAVCGFACIFVGMELMKSIVPAMQARGLLEWFMSQSQKSLLWGVIAGTVLTAIIQSSAASIAMTMSLAATAAISVDLGIAIVLGANIGTCLTALLASIGGSRAGQFVAWSHVILNVGGAVLFYPLISALFYLVTMLTDSPAAQIAHAQTIYNILCSAIALPVCYLPWLRKMEPA